MSPPAGGYRGGERIAMPGLLDGVRVVDLTNVLAGPIATYQLALLGAEVIKIERPGSGDLARRLGADTALNEIGMGASFLAQNAAKRSLTLDLKADGGREALLRLVATADVVVENFRPGVMDRLGLGHDALRAARADIIHCAISGFGQDGPMSANPAYDQIVQGLSGAMSVTGDAETGPLRAGFPVSDSLGGLTAAFAISAALFHRATTGEGRMIDVSMLDSTLVAMGWVVSNHLIAGQAPVAMGNDNFTASPSGAFRTNDGLLNIAANEQSQFEALCHVVGRDDLALDARFRGRDDRKVNRGALTAELEAALAGKSAAEWETILTTAGVPAGRVLTVPEILDHAQIAERGLIARLDPGDGLDRDISVLGSGFLVSGQRPRPLRPPPVLGRDADAILAELGYSDDDIAALRREGVV
jgi:crotonobetainyl-CoA:carnitine CoA-transferase CaiB-like acyl-CoA transferase